MVIGEINMGYLICNQCKGYYKLQPGEKPEEFTDNCNCGGRLRYTQSIDVVTPPKDFSNKDNKRSNKDNNNQESKENRGKQKPDDRKFQKPVQRFEESNRSSFPFQLAQFTQRINRL